MPRKVNKKNKTETAVVSCLLRSAAKLQIRIGGPSRQRNPASWFGMMMTGARFPRTKASKALAVTTYYVIGNL